MNKIFPLVLIVVCMIRFTHAQIGIGTYTPHESAIVDVSSSNQGFLPPRMTNLQMRSIQTPADGLIVYCTNCCEESGSLIVHADTGWFNLLNSCNLDTDGDGVNDLLDIDSDNDGIVDGKECQVTPGVGVSIIEDNNTLFNASNIDPTTSNAYIPSKIAEFLFELGTDAFIDTAYFNTGYDNRQVGVFNDLDKISFISGPNNGENISSFGTGIIFSSGDVNSLNESNSNTTDIFTDTDGPNNDPLFNTSVTSHDVVYLTVVINVPQATRIQGKYFFWF